MSLEREKKLELIRRALGLRHKLKVHESMKQPETHEELALTTLARWDLEDELRAIDSYLDEVRDQSVQARRQSLRDESGQLAADRSSGKPSK